MENINSPSENNKRIAKNTLFLYFRSILTLGVGLYTSREVLAQLGVSDFGIYNVVGGVIVLFSFIQNAMNSASSRFFTFDLGKGDYEQLKKTFSLSIVIHVFTALIVLVLGETIGLWFLNTQLNIPAERMVAANFVYQFTIFTACAGVLQMPYMVAINAHEKMKVYAYAGIADAVFKLAVAISLGFASVDKLKFYSVLLFMVYVVMAAFYRVYCHKNFKETHFRWFWDKKMFLERMGFGGHELLGGVSGVLAVQGGIILINRFYGVLLNAANGISLQVVNAAQQFTNNFFAAVSPQITKSLAAGEMDYFYKLIIRSSKFCFLLSFAFMAPLALQMDFILSIWLKIVPDYAGIFCQFSIVNIFLWIAFWPISHGIVSTGNNRTFRKIDSFMVMLVFPFTYLGLHFSPVGYICSHIFVNFFRMIYWTLTLRKLTGFSIRSFLSQSLFKCLAVAAISILLPIYITLNMSNWQGFLACIAAFFATFAPSALFIGLSKNEREETIRQVKQFLFNVFHFSCFEKSSKFSN
jgi:O-antigen/teichoic acid export membrane protein